MEMIEKKIIKFISACAICLAFRFVPCRIPNFDPIMSIQMAFSKINGFIFGFMFGFFNILLFDLICFKINIFSFVTATIYGLLGIFFSLMFIKNIFKSYYLLTIFGTIIFDFSTVFVGPIFFNQSLSNAIIGQIPFTINHLIFNLGLSIIITPFVEKLLQNKFYFYTRVQ